MTPRKYEVAYSSLARDDLRDIYQHIAHVLKVPNVAKRQVERIEKAVRGLSQFPMRHEAVDWEPWYSMGIRRLKVDNYLVFYRASEERGLVEVVRVLYAGMDIREMARRDTSEG